MICNLTSVSNRTVLGCALALWIIVIALVSLRVASSGPLWGVHLAPVGPDSAVVVDAVSHGIAGFQGGIRTGDVVTAIDDGDPSAFAGGDIPSSVHEVDFQGEDGATVRIDFDSITTATLIVLWGGALVFVTVGSVVYRWSADVAIGRAFLVFAASFATALASAPVSRLGYPLVMNLPGAAALVASPSLLVLFMLFPRHLQGVRIVAVLTGSVSAALIVAQLLETELPRQVAVFLDMSAWLWCVLTLLAGLAVAGWRARNPRDRDALSPLIPGTVVAVLPLTLLTWLPLLLNLPMALDPQFAAVAMAALPVAFAYSILRFQVFGLDVLMRRVILQASHILVGIGLFLLVWLVARSLSLSGPAGVLTALVACGVCMPTLRTWTTRRVDGLLYQPLSNLSLSPSLGEAETLEQLGATVSSRIREMLPVQWAACVIHDDTTPADSAARRILGFDGRLPCWLHPGSSLEQSPTEVSASPVHRFENNVVLLLAGPRLDAGRLDGIQLEALRLLARGVAPSFEAGLLREVSNDETAFRDGLTELARDLAAAATVNDVLRAFSSHARRLLNADTATLALGPSADGAPAQDADADLLEFGVGGGGDEPAICRITRSRRLGRFGAREIRRARELAEHTTGALRRAAEREKLEAQLRHRAFYDSLTGLPNRALFLDRIAHARARAERMQQQIAVMFIDLDRFKVVNDSLGHSAGDQLLIQVGERLRACLRESDTIARLGGDEFTVLLEGSNAIGDAVNAARRILTTLEAPFVLSSQEAYTSASVGIAGGPVARDVPRDLLREADIALYHAKASGRGRYTVYDPRMSQVPGEYLHLESDLHRAIERNELKLHYQPIFELRSSEITGVEALLRWDHPEKGMIPPTQFIPLAEETGLIGPIGKWVLEEACRQLRDWRARAVVDERLFVSVNLSARQLQDPSLTADVQQIVQASGIDAQALQLEITESVVMQDPGAMAARLNALKALGIRLAIDDFGTGYSSLAYLKRFPIDVLKIDRAFVSGLSKPGHDSAIIQTVVGLARAMGLRTTAEGIEERSQWDRLEQLGCDLGQGFIFSRPVRAEEIVALIAAERRHMQPAA